MAKENREIKRFVDFVGGNQKAADVFGISYDMLRKLKEGDRNFKPEYANAMYKHKGFKLNWVVLHENY